LNDIEKLFIDGLTQVLSGQVEQDIPILENKIYLENALLCDGDGPIAKYRKWFTQFYA
jgi:3-ketosteroid 9alpha-monooxygenase subunit A